MSIEFSMHPEYYELFDEWTKFRYIKIGGQSFIEKYVEKFSKAEDDSDFEKRKRITPVAGFAKSAIVDVRNSIFQRMASIRRLGGPNSWQEAVAGKLGGVDLFGSTMNHFIGTDVLPELLFMGKVGIYVDNFEINQRRTLKQRGKEHPYIYTFVAEDIRNWEYFTKGSEVKLRQVLLRVRTESVDPETSLISSLIDGYRHYWVDEDKVFCQEYDSVGKELDEPLRLETDTIPLHILELESSLLTDIANHQITLTNMESADVGMALRSNLPVYTEQADQRHSLLNNRSNEGDGIDNPQERRIGDTDGILYTKERPGFIHPSSEPLRASMEKQKALKDDIRQLVNLALSNTKSRFASAQSKELDERGLEAGLSAIGLVLEHAERHVVAFWSDYENSTEEAQVHYPERYSLTTDAERRADAEQLTKSSSSVSSPRFRREMQKEVARILLGGKIDDNAFNEILTEIDSSEYPTGDPDQIRSDAEAMLVSHETASLARGYKTGEAAKALEEKMKLIESQAKTQGVIDPKEEKRDSQSPDNNIDGKKLVRGQDANTGN